MPKCLLSVNTRADDPDYGVSSVNLAYVELPLGGFSHTYRAGRTVLFMPAPLRLSSIHRLFRPTRLRSGPSVVHNICDLHSFADDTQLQLHCHREDTTAAAAQLTDCVVDISRWMTANRLKLNRDKTELLWTGSHSILPVCCIL